MKALCRKLDCNWVCSDLPDKLNDGQKNALLDGIINDGFIVMLVKDNVTLNAMGFTDEGINEMEAPLEE